MDNSSLHVFLEQLYVYIMCEEFCDIYSSESWPMKVKHEIKLDGTEDVPQIFSKIITFLISS